MLPHFTVPSAATPATAARRASCALLWCAVASGFTPFLSAADAPAPVVGAASASSPALTVEQRLEALEARLGALATENSVLKKRLGLDPAKPATADAVAKAPALVTAAGKVSKLSLGGYLQLQAEAGDAPDSRFPAGDRFLVRRARATLRGTYAEQFDFLLTSDFSPNTLGSSTGARAQLTDVSVTWTRFPAAQVTLGQFKTPYGYEQLLADTKTLFIERSLPNDLLTLSRQIGAMVSGSVAEKRLTYSLGAFNGSGVNTSVNDNDQAMFVARLAGTIIATEAAKLTAGTGAFTSRDTGTFTGRREGFAVDLQLTAGRFETGAEYFLTDFDRDTGTDTEADGWSAYAGFFVLPKKLQAVARYETYSSNRASAATDADLWTAGLTYYLKGDDLKFSLNYLLGDPTGPLADQARLLGRLQVIF